MPKNTYHEDWGIGEWGGNDPQADIDPDTQTELGPRFPIYRNSDDFNMNKVLLGNVQRNNYFKELTKFTTFKQVVALSRCATTTPSSRRQESHTKE